MFKEDLEGFQYIKEKNACEECVGDENLYILSMKEGHICRAIKR